MIIFFVEFWKHYEVILSIDQLEFEPALEPAAISTILEQEISTPSLLLLPIFSSYQQFCHSSHLVSF